MLTLDEVYSWVHRFEPMELSQPAQHLVYQMNQALERGDSVLAWHTIDQLKQLNRVLYRDLEFMDISLRCGIACFRLGDLNEAAGQFLEAMSRTWTRFHHYAIAQWMWGHVLWMTPSTRFQGKVAWERSISTFEQLALRFPRLSTNFNWYNRRIAHMRFELADAMREADTALLADPFRPGRVIQPSESPIARIVQPSGGDFPPAAGPNPPADDGSSELEDTVPIRTSFAFNMLVFNSIDHFQNHETNSTDLPAPQMRQVSVNNETGNDLLDIEGERHRMVRVNNRLSSIASNLKFCVIVRVNGDVMNKAEIDDGDHLLIHRRLTANHWDIVAAQIALEEEFYATIKRFLKRGNKIILRSESEYPSHPEFVFNPPHGGFFIRGVVLAVLKSI